MRTTHLFLLWSTALLPQQKNLMKTWIKLMIGNSNGRWILTLTSETSPRRKLYEVSHPKLFFNNADVSQTNFQKYLGVVVDSKLIFYSHLDQGCSWLDVVFTKVRKTIALLRKLNSILPRAALVAIFKNFVGPRYWEYWFFNML